MIGLKAIIVTIFHVTNLVRPQQIIADLGQFGSSVAAIVDNLPCHQALVWFYPTFEFLDLLRQFLVTDPILHSG